MCNLNVYSNVIKKNNFGSAALLKLSSWVMKVFLFKWMVKHGFNHLVTFALFTKIERKFSAGTG